MNEAEKHLRLYKESDAAEDFARFLEVFMPSLDRRIRRFADLYRLEHHFEDLKWVYIETIYTELSRFDQTLGVPFFAFAKARLYEALHDYVRLFGGAFTIQQAGHYRSLRTAAYFYYNSDLQTRRERIQFVAGHLKMSTSAVDRLIAEAEAFRFYDSTNPSDDGDDITEPRDLDFADTSLDPYAIVEKEMIRSELIEAIEKILGYKEQQILYRSCGIRCIYCGGLCKRETYAELANSFEYSSASTVEKARKKAIEKVVYELCERKLLTCVKLVRTELNDTSLVYSYLVNGDDGREDGGVKSDNDGFGIISFNLAEHFLKDKSMWECYTIEQLAALDTTKFHRYANRVVGIVNSMGDVFQKELLAVWLA